MKHYLLRILVAVFTLSFAVEAQVTTSGINGTIHDAATKEELIGASVVAKHLPTGTVYGAATNAKGNFLLQGLRPGGPYTIEVSYIGYQTTKLENVMLSLGETETLNVVLRDDTQALEQVVITGQNRNAQFNATRTGAGSSFNRTAIERTPTVSRSIFDIAKLTPQANTGSSGTSFAGASNKYNSFQIDGTVNNDVFGLSSSGTNGGATGTNPISLEAVEAVQVVIAPFDVRQGGFTGGGINAITKSGSNKFTGSLYDFYQNQDFYGTTPGKDVEHRKPLDTQYANTLGFTLGGPILKDKLFFFVNGEYVDETYPSVNGIEEGSRVTKAQADQVLSHVKTLIPGYSSTYGKHDVPTKNYKGLARLDWNINQAHRLTLRASYVDAMRFSYSNTEATLSFLDQAFTYKSRTLSLVGELHSRFSSSLSNELRAGYTRIRDSREISGDMVPYFRVGVGNNNEIRLGSAPSAIANRLDQDIYTLTNNLTWTTGNHTLTFGTHNELFNIYNLFINNYAGYYRFSSIANFQANKPSEYTFQRTNPAVMSDRLWGPSFRAAQLAFYAQDEWRATDNLRLTYGLRADLPLFIDTPTSNAGFNASPIALKHGVVNNQMPETRILWSPRIGFRYTLDETRRELIRGGVGIFTGRVPFVWISNSFSNSGVEYLETRIGSRDWAKYPDFYFSTDLDNMYVKPYSAIAIAGKNFRFPQILRANLAFETTLPGGVRATLEGMFTKNLNNIRVRNLMVESTGAVLDHGSVERPLYQNLTSTALPYSSAVLLENSNKGYAYSLTAQLTKDFDFGLSASLAYTYGKSLGANDGKSSIAYSNWQYNYNFAGQDTDELWYSDHDLRHRLVATLNYRVEYGKHFATTIGLVYNGQSGSRYSFLYNGDVNGDGVSDNDLLYVPTSAEVAAMTFAGSSTVSAADMASAFESYIASHPQLSQYRGEVAPRNAFTTPFVNKFDLHFAQDFYLHIGGRRHTLQLNADVLNIGNLIDRAWGLTPVVQYANYRLLGYNQGKYTFTAPRGDVWGQALIDSRWRAQIGVKYIF